MSLKPSFYNYYTSANDPDNVILFNKARGSVSVLPAAMAEAIQAGNVASLSSADREELLAAGFLVEDGIDEIAGARARYEHNKANNSLLSLTIELTQECNLACTYCYQNSYRKIGQIREDTIDGILKYVEEQVVTQKRPFTDIVLRFIGGEPLLQKKKVLAAVEQMRALADRLGVVLHTQIDTNGVLLDENVVRGDGHYLGDVDQQGRSRQCAGPAQRRW